jgi:DNA repair protein RecO (recombination protein O)
LAIYNADAVVIRVRDFDEADKVVTLLTREEGKVQAVARGIQRPRKPLFSRRQLFTHFRAQLYHGRNLETLSQLDIVDSFRRLREDLLLMAYASYLCELADELIREKERSETPFLLLLAVLHLLNEGTEPEPLLRAFQLKLLSMLGFRPNLEDCVSCGGPLPEGQPVRFAPGAGGTFCGKCSPDGEKAVLVSRGALETMKRLLDADIRRTHIIRLSPEVQAEVARSLDEYVTYRVEKRLKSRDFLDSMRG